MGLLIDTSVIVEIERREDSLNEFLERLQGEDTAISSITASELLVGVSRGAPEERRASREAFVEYVLERVAVLPVDLSVARTHARLWVQLSASGMLIGPHDVLIAATALTHDFAIMTNNIRHFTRVPGLEVRQPSW